MLMLEDARLRTDPSVDFYSKTKKKKRGSEICLQSILRQAALHTRFGGKQPAGSTIPGAAGGARGLQVPTEAEQTAHHKLQQPYSGAHSNVLTGKGMGFYKQVFLVLPGIYYGQQKESFNRANLKLYL